MFIHVNLRRMHIWRYVTGLGGGDVNVHVNVRHMHIWRYVTGLGGGDVNVHVNLRHMQVWRYVTGLGGIVLCKETTQKENNKKPILIHTGGVDAMSLDRLQRPC